MGIVSYCNTCCVVNKIGLSSWSCASSDLGVCACMCDLSRCTEFEAYAAHVVAELVIVESSTLEIVRREMGSLS